MVCNDLEMVVFWESWGGRVVNSFAKNFSTGALISIEYERGRKKCQMRIDRQTN